MTDENKKIKILLIDDDKFLLDMYSLKFKSKGLEVDVCPGSLPALTKLRAGDEFDILLLDIIMPSMDGIELLETIRKEKLAENAVVIMLTNQADDAERATKVGVDGFIVKATSIPSEVIEEVLSIYNAKHHTQ
jgi:CheY-like chemotaxis protein